MKFQDLIDESQIALDVEARDKFEVIRRLADLFDGKEIISDKLGYYDAVIEREGMFATAIGMSVAIPHGKTDIVKRAAVAFGRLREPLLWDPDENEEVSIIFLLAVPETNTENTHLVILASLARALIHDEIREAFLNAETSGDVMRVFEKIPIKGNLGKEVQ